MGATLSAIEPLRMNHRVHRLIAVLSIAAVALLAAAGPGGARPAHPKRGVASARELARDPAVLRRLGASWAYDWSATPPPSDAVAWVPMLWGSGSVTPATISRLTHLARAGRVHQLLGFNEPDSGAQANLSPEQAAALWPELERTGLALGSPAPAVPDDGWLSRFMAIARARRLRVDFIALHFYQDDTDPGAVAALRRQLIALHAEYRRPLWITEIGAMNIAAWGEPMRHRPSAAAARRYMRALFAMLDGLPFVQRYAWFTDACAADPGCRDSSLLDARGRPTPLATTYRTAP